MSAAEARPGEQNGLNRKSKRPVKRQRRVASVKREIIHFEKNPLARDIRETRWVPSGDSLNHSLYAKRSAESLGRVARPIFPFNGQISCTSIENLAIRI